MKKLCFEELEKVEELGPVMDFSLAALPWVAIGLAVAIILTKYKNNDPESSESKK